ncbi:MAG: hypothetical protein AAF485_32145 [Chloroflexota bacterium]
MTLPKKKSRKIIVDDQIYRYLIADRGTNLNLAIEADDTKGQLVSFQVPYCDPWLKLSVEQVSDEKLPDNQIQSITPSFVKSVIIFALEKGWQPTTKQKPLQVMLEDGKLKLVHP